MAPVVTVPDEHRLTGLMEDASRVIEQHPGQFGKTALASELGGRKQAALKAIDGLIAGGFAETTPGRKGRVV